MPSEIFDHMLRAVGEQPEERVGVGQTFRITPPLNTPVFNVPTPRLILPTPGFRAVQPVVPIQGLVGYNFVPFLLDAAGKKVSHMFTDIPVIQMSVLPAQLKQRLQFIVSQHAPLLANNQWGVAYLCYVAYRVSDGAYADSACSPGYPTQFQFPLHYP